MRLLTLTRNAFLKIHLDQFDLKKSKNISKEYYIVALVTVAVYFAGYLWFAVVPGHSTDSFLGWFGWWDQGKYLESTKALAQWNFSSNHHIYPLGYPLLGVPFVRWLPLHPYLIPNLIFSTGIVLAFYASCRRMLSVIESFFLSFFLIILSGFTSTKAITGGLIWFDTLMIPWNNIPVFFAAYLTTYLLVFNTGSIHRFWVASVSIALAFFSRPPDVLFLTIIYLAGLVDLKSIKEKTQGLLVLALCCFVTLFLTLVFRWAIFNTLISPYDVIVGNQGFSLYDLPFKLYLIFFDGSPVYGYKELMLLPQMPWLLLCLPGIVLIAKYTHSKSWFLIASIVVCLVIYTSYNFQIPSNMMNYHGYRYFVWIFPWLGLCSYLTVTRSSMGIGRWKTILGISAVVIFALIIGWKETTVATISDSTKRNVGRVSQFYDSTMRKFVSEIKLSEPTPVEGLQIVFSQAPSKNMMAAGAWQYFSLTIDGKKQTLIRDYNLYQSGYNVYITFRNPINQTGKFQNALVQYDDTDWPILDKIYILKSEFKLFGFILQMLVLFESSSG